MTDAGKHITIQMGLAQQLNAQAQLIRELRATLAEKEKTNQALIERIVKLQRQLAELQASSGGAHGSRHP